MILVRGRTICMIQKKPPIARGFCAYKGLRGLALHAKQGHAADGQKQRPQRETAIIAGLRDSGDEKSEADICL